MLAIIKQWPTMTVRSVTLSSKTRTRTTVGPSRRSFLKWGSASLLSLVDMTRLVPIPIAQASEPEVPILEGLSLIVVTDDVTSEAAKLRRLPDLMIEELGTHAIGNKHRSGLIPDRSFSLHVRSLRRTEMRNILLDFGSTNEALSNNMECLRIDPAALDQVLSLDRERERLRLPLIAGRWNDVTTIGDHGFLSPSTAWAATAATNEVSAGANISSNKGVLPSTSEECAREWSAITVSFLLIARGLIVITSCDPRSLVAAVQQAQSASGVETVHAVVIGTNMADAGGQREIQEAIAALKGIDPDHVVLGHCSGNLFYEAAMSAMPDRVIRTAAGMRISFVL
jgi:7,8-dihydropterin-6-yl-methyl-4-(beta-D-ribofuranosyl)aminobenzene 5'-phosphate synthase